MVELRTRHDYVVRLMAVALVLLLAAIHPAHGTSSSSSSSWQLWRWRSLLSEATADDGDSSSPTTTVRLVAVLAPPITANSSSNAAVGSNLHASDQCGGAGGLCNQTTIGIPCGDHAWQSVNCPQNFTCSRRNASYWRCTLIPGRIAPRDAAFNSSERYVPAAQLLPGGGQLDSRTPGNAPGSSSSSNNPASQSSVPHHSDEPIVPVCGPDALRGHNKMCNRTNQFILPLDSVDPAAAGAAATSAAGISRASACAGLAVQLLRLGAVFLGAAAGAAVYI